MNVSAIIVTRGDVDLKEILRSLPEEWDVLVWNNGEGSVSRRVAMPNPLLARIVTGKGELPDLAVYGRYAAIEYASGELIYVQDDDCIVSDPQALVDAYNENANGWRFDLPNPKPSPMTPWPRLVVCNMPPEFRHDFYTHHSLVGFGAVFQRDAPQRAFERLGLVALPGSMAPDIDLFYRTCDIVFTALTPRVLVDVPKKNLWWAEDETRMYRQAKHVEERTRMLELVRQIA